MERRSATSDPLSKHFSTGEPIGLDVCSRPAA
jgi:hypothetical protein